MRRFDENSAGKKVYVGRHLEPDVTSDELRDLFAKYGSIRAIWIARNPPGFAYVTFEDTRDANDACRSLDGTEFGGKRLRVEIAHGPRPSRPERGGYHDRDRSFSPGRGAPLRRRSPSYGTSPGIARSRRRRSQSPRDWNSRRQSPPYRDRHNPNDIPLRRDRSRSPIPHRSGKEGSREVRDYRSASPVRPISGDHEMRDVSPQRDRYKK